MTIINGLLAILTIFVLIIPSSKAQSYRLPNNVIPTHYDITLDVDLVSFTFTGNVEISIDVLETSNTITLHINDIQLGTVELINFLNATTTPSNIVIDTSDKQFLHLTFANQLVQNETYTLKIAYIGNLNDQNVGFYRAFYFDDLNQARPLAVTQFQSTDARRAFPCFDEPGIRTTYRIKLIKDEQYSSASNMNQEQSNVPILGTNKTCDVYAISYPMASYLVAFLISDFTRAVDGLVGVYGRSQGIQQGQANYALQIGNGAVEHMQSFTGVLYTLPKLDQVALPNEYFLLGGMENWGLVCYKERVLFYNNATSTTAEEQQITTIISHELSHQWTGDLVTPTWWMYIWLNEGFATYFEYYVANQLQPTFGISDQFVIDNIHTSFASDALTTTRPISFDAQSPDEIAALYDLIAYEKCGSVIRMIEHLITTPVFRAGLGAYLNKMSFLNSVPSDVYVEWQKAFDAQQPNSTVIVEPISNIISTWELQSGYPVVRISRINNTGSFLLEQEQFFLLKNSTSSTQWKIPINYASAANPNFDDTTVTLLLEQPFTWDLNIPVTDWIIFNKQLMGYYRVNYDDANWQLLVNYLNGPNFTTIHISNRAQLVDDSLNLARAEQLQYSVAFDIAKYLKNEITYVPAAAFVNALRFLNDMLLGTTIYNNFQLYVLDILNGIYNRIGFEIDVNDDHLTKLTRMKILPWLCQYGHAECQNKSSGLFNSWASDFINEIPPDLQAAVYCDGLRQSTINSDATLWNPVQASLQGIFNEDTKRIRIATALGCSNDQTILNQYILLILSNSPSNGLRPSEKVLGFTSVYMNNGQLGLQVALDTLSINLAIVKQTFSSGRIARFIRDIGTKVTTSQQLTKLQQIVTLNEAIVDVTIVSAVDTAVKSAQYNIDWLARNMPQLQLYFGMHSSASSYFQIKKLVWLFIGYFILYLL